jgi:hypothetical protein
MAAASPVLKSLDAPFPGNYRENKDTVTRHEWHCIHKEVAAPYTPQGGTEKSAVLGIYMAMLFIYNDLF